MKNIFYKCSLIFRSMRLHQWIKNLLVFVPLFAASQYTAIHNDFQILLAFVVFGLTASAGYVINDLIDLPYDRHHHRKRHRPIAAGKLKAHQGWILSLSLLLIALIIALAFFSVAFQSVLIIYFISTLTYSLWLKKIIIVDVLMLAALYTLRIIAGGVAIAVPLSFWLLSFSMFIFLSLAFLKRFSELKIAAIKGESGKVRGRGYVQDDLGMIANCGVASAYLSVLVLGFYVYSPITKILYRSPEVIWVACPLLFYWVSRLWMIAYRGEMDDDPVLFALKDKVSWFVGFCFIACFILARVLV